MPTLKVDFNDVLEGRVRGLSEEFEGPGEPAVEGLILLDDGEGNEALGVVRSLERGLIFAEVDWDTWGPTGHIKTGFIDDNNGWQIEVVEQQLLAAAA